MNVEITVKSVLLRDLHQLILNLIEHFTAGERTPAPTVVEEKMRPKKGAVKKAAKEEVEEEDGIDGDTDDGDGLDEGEEDGGSEETEDDDDTPEPEPVKKKTASGVSKTKATAPQAVKGAAKAKGPSLEDDMIPAFQAYSAKHSREEARKVLTKYGVKNVRDLPVEKYPEILKKLKG